MIKNRLTPQANEVFQARLQELVVGIERDITQIKQRYNSRNVLLSTGTVREIYGRIDVAISDMGKIASESAKLAYETGNHQFSTLLESELLDAFEANFSLGYERLHALRICSTQSIRDSLANKQMHEDDSAVDVARRTKIEGQLALRQYFQVLKRARKKWHAHIIDVAKLILPFFRKS